MSGRRARHAPARTRRPALLARRDHDRRGTAPGRRGVPARLRARPPAIPAGLRGVAAVTRLRLAQWRRRPRAPLALAAAVLALYAPALLAWSATAGADDAVRGMLVHSLTVCGLLAGGSVAMPLLTASAWTDRAALDTLRAVPLREWQIVLGHLAAAVAVPAAVTLAAVPLLVLAAASGGAGPAAPLLAVLVLTVVYAAIAAIGLLASASARRSGVALALGYAGLAVLALGPLVAYGTVTGAGERPAATRVIERAPPSADGPVCREATRERPRSPSDRTWWLLAGQPLVVAADAAPARLAPGIAFEPLDATRQAVRTARAGVREPVLECRADAATARQDTRAARAWAEAAPPVWPWGLAALLGLGAGCLALTTQALVEPPFTRCAGRRTVLRRRRRRPRRDGYG